MPEAPTLPEYLTPTEFLGYVGRIRNLPKERIATRTSELLKALDLVPKADETIASLSKGMKAKVAFAAAIIHEPSILVLDEPLIGIDPAGQHLLKERLLGMAQAGSTVLVSTHQLDTAERLCGRVAIVHPRRNVPTGDPSALRTPAAPAKEGSPRDGFLRALGAGVTAHASEFDFFLTADVRPREYLAADLLFQLVSLLGAGGLSASVAAIGMAVTAGRPASAALSLFGLLIVYAFFVLMTSQVLVILRVRFPKAPVRLVTAALLILSMLPAAALADPAFPIRFADLPLPSSAYAALGLAVLRGAAWPVLDVVLPPVYAGGIAITQTLTLARGIRAINGAFCERENLWIVLTSAQGPAAYFRGLMLSFATIGLVASAPFFVLLVATRSLGLPIESLAVAIASPIAGGFAAAALLTRIKLKPSALSFAALGIFFLVSLGGILGGLAAEGVLLAARAIGVMAVEAQATILFGFLLTLAALGLWTVTRLAAAFRL